MIDPQMLDILMRGYESGGYGPPPLPPNVPGGPRELNMAGLGPDPEDSPRGSTLQDLYDFLMNPRHRRERSISPGGRFTHYGPSRSPSVSGEDQAAAKLIMQQMKEDEDRQLQKERWQAGSSVMSGRGPEAGGKISTSGTTGARPTRFGAGGPGQPAGSGVIAPKPALTSDERIISGAGGFPPDPILEAQVRASARTGMTESGQRSYLKTAAGFEQKAREIQTEVMSEIQLSWPELKEEFGDDGWDAIVQKYVDGEFSAFAKKNLTGYINEYLGYLKDAFEARTMARGFENFDPAASQVQGAADYAAGSDGQINRVEIAQS